MAAAPFVLRVATPDDAAVLGELAARTFAETFGSLYPTAEGLQAFLTNAYNTDQMRREIEDPERRTILVFPVDDAHRPCGFTMLKDGGIRPGDVGRAPEDCLEIKRVYVDSAFHGTGAGKLLMDRVMEIAAEKKIVWLEVWDQNHRAIKFYRKYGFEATSQHSFPAGDVVRADYVFTRMQQ